MKILIIDDEPLARQELSYLIREINPEYTLFEANSIKTALGVLLKEAIDLIFLDMQLQEEKGLELMEHIEIISNPPLVVFATAYDDYAVKAFELNALDYILKPFDPTRLKEVIDKAENQRQLLSFSQRKVTPAKEVSDNLLPIHFDDRIIMVPVTEIQVVTIEGGEVLIITSSQRFTSKESLKSFQEKLPEQFFMQVHRASIINTRKVHEIQPWFNRTYQVTMNNGEKVQVSRSYVNQFKEFFGFT